MTKPDAAKPDAALRRQDGAPLRVLDFTSVMAGPYCTRLLADIGAEVIKIEPPEGDGIRVRPPLREGRSAYYGHLNCGKKSVVLDLKSEQGLGIARDLARDCDVLVENFRPGVMAKFGLDYARAAEANPGLVYCSISGFGHGNDDSRKPAYAPIVHATSGFDLAFLGHQPPGAAPPNTAIFIADVLAAVYAFGAIQTALLQRERTGAGQRVDVALMDSILSLLMYECQDAQFPVGRRRHTYRPMKTSDGYVVIAPTSQRNYLALIAALGHPAWSQAPGYLTVGEREANWGEFMDRIEEWTRGRTAAEVETILTAAGAPCARYRTFREVMDDPVSAARGRFETVSDGAGPFQVTNPPFKFSDLSAHVRGTVAELGADGEDVLRRLLGYDEARIAAARDGGAFG